MAAHRVIDMLTDEVIDAPAVNKAVDNDVPVMEAFDPLFDGEPDYDEEESVVPSIEHDDDDKNSLFESGDDDDAAQTQTQPQQPAQNGLLLPCLTLPSAHKQRTALPVPASTSDVDTDAPVNTRSTPAASADVDVDVPAQSTIVPTKRGPGRPKKDDARPPTVPRFIYLCRFGCSAGQEGRDVVNTYQTAFDTVTKLRCHMRTQHNLVYPEQKVNDLRCNTCHKVFPDVDKAQRHFVNCWPTERVNETPPQWKPMPQTRQERADTWAYQIDGTPSRNVRFRWNAAINKGEVVTNAPTAIAPTGNSYSSPQDSVMGSPAPRGSKRKASTDLRDVNEANTNERPAKRTKQRHSKTIIDLTDESSSSSAPVAPVTSPQPVQTQPALQPQQDASDDIALVDDSELSAAKATAYARYLSRQAERDRQAQQHAQEMYRRQMMAQQAAYQQQRAHQQQQAYQQQQAQQQLHQQAQQREQQQAQAMYRQQTMAQHAAEAWQVYSMELGVFRGPDGSLYQQGMDGMMRLL